MSLPTSAADEPPSRHTTADPRRASRRASPRWLLPSILFTGGLLVGLPFRGTVASPDNNTTDRPMKLGAFSISLTVKDLETSRAFYEKLGFRPVGGDAEHNYLILQNADETTIGLFQGMFDKNILTFNPGWGSKKEELEDFTDVRELQRTFEERGLKLTLRAEPSSKGPAHFTMVDPDGNPILFDQHR